MKLVLVDADPKRSSEVQRRLVSLGHEAYLAYTKRDALAAIQPAMTTVVLIAADKLGYAVGNILRNRRKFFGVRLLMYGESEQRKSMEQHASLPTRAHRYLTLPARDSELQGAIVSVSEMPELSRSKEPPLHTLPAATRVAAVLTLAASAVLASVGHVLHKTGWQPTISGLTLAGLVGYVVAEGGTLIRRGSLPRWRVGVVVLMVAYLVLRASGSLLERV